MSKARKPTLGPIKDTLRPEYTSRDFPGGLQRGRYAAKAKAASNLIVLDADLAVAFPDSAAVNETLRAVLKAAKRVTTQA